MKKRISILLIAILFLPCVLLITACGKVEFKINFMVDNTIYYSINTSGSETITLPKDPTKEGFIFDGWYWDDNVWQKPFTANSLLNEPLKSNMSVYAKWGTDNTPKGTQANFDSFTKENETTFSLSVSNKAETLNMSSVVRVSNTSSWKLTTDIQGTTIVPSKIATLNVGDNTYYILVTTNNDDVCLYTLKIRRRPIYTVSFNGYAQNQYIEEDECAIEPSKPEKKGYTFGGWDFDFSKPIKEETVILPILTPNNYVITFHSNDDRNIKETKVVTFNTSCRISLKKDMSKDYYQLEYFSVNPDGSGAHYPLNSMLLYNLDRDWDLYAVWTPISYSISYHNDGGSIVDNPTNYNVLSELFLLEPIKEDYIFEGWYTDEQFTNKISQIKKGSFGNLNLYAKFSPIRYNITYILNGGKNNSHNPICFTAQDETIELSMPEKDGYEIGYWTYNNQVYSYIPSGTRKELTLVANYFNNSEGQKFICDKEDMLEVLGNEEFWNKELILLKNIDFGGQAIQSIKLFTGIIQGNNFSLSNYELNVSIANVTNQNIGLIEQTDNADILNLELKNFSIKIEKPYIYNLVSGYNIGGLIGFQNAGVISNCEISGTIIVDLEKYGQISSGNARIEAFVGGIIGYGSGKIEKSISNCDINAKTYVSVSSYSSFPGLVSSNSVTYVGGIAGYYKGDIMNCFSKGRITAWARSSAWAGGFVGSFAGDIANSYSLTNITANSTQSRVGGLIGIIRNDLSETTVNNCYTQSSLYSFSDSTVGYSYAGYIVSDDAEITITNSSTANIESKGSLIDNGITPESLVEILQNMSQVWDKDIWYFDGYNHPYLLG